MKKKYFFLLIMLLITIALIVAPATAKRPVVNQELVTLELTKAVVTTQGQVIEMAEGVFYQDFVIEAKARTKAGQVFPEGDFVMTLSAFSPYQDMDKQKAGMWYVVGKWTITDKNADPAALKTKHNPNVMEGMVMSELPFNPLTDTTPWTGKALLQMGLAAGRWSRGEGTLSFNGETGGLYLDLSRWPELAQ